MANHLPIFYWGIAGVITSLILGNLFALINIQRNFAEIFFVSGHFCLITVDELLFGRKNEVFPLSYASPSRTTDRIMLHYHDRVIELRKEDWPDFEIIWNWLTNPPPDITYHYSVSKE
ncbi:MAG: hypothetical protein NZ108_03105 [Bacteroidia bacterium]|nr:hypothetical protein [Bacteroidia bacterium]